MEMKKKTIPKIRKWELEALIPRNDREGEWKENIQWLKKSDNQCHIKKLNEFELIGARKALPSALYIVKLKQVSILHFASNSQLQFPTKKCQIREREGNENILFPKFGNE